MLRSCGKKDMKIGGHISHQTSFLLLVKTISENSHPVNGLVISLDVCVHVYSQMNVGLW